MENPEKKNFYETEREKNKRLDERNEDPETPLERLQASDLSDQELSTIQEVLRASYENRHKDPYMTRLSDMSREQLRNEFLKKIQGSKNAENSEALFRLFQRKGAGEEFMKARLALEKQGKSELDEEFKEVVADALGNLSQESVAKVKKGLPRELRDILDEVTTYDA